MGLRPQLLKSLQRRKTTVHLYEVWCPKRSIHKRGWKLKDSKLADEVTTKNDYRSSPQQDSFKWPSTEADMGSGKGLSKSILQERGLLSEMGYRVGTNGLPKSQRLEILRNIYLNELKVELQKNYMGEWGRPESAQRLKKLAETLAALTRNAKRRHDKPMAAIHEWEEDLAYLKKKFYDGFYDFAWPQV